MRHRYLDIGGEHVLKNLFPHVIHVHVIFILIYMREKMVSVTPSVLYPHNGVDNKI
jgi:hypothetical protein